MRLMLTTLLVMFSCAAEETWHDRFIEDNCGRCPECCAEVPISREEDGDDDLSAFGVQPPYANRQAAAEGAGACLEENSELVSEFGWSVGQLHEWCGVADGGL